MPRRCFCCFTALLATAACHDAPPASSVSAIRDSAGVTIVENRDTGWTTQPPWKVASQSILSIGTENGAAPYRFDGIAGAIRLAHGGIAVADRGSSSIRFYDSTGTFRSAVGRDGQGPGEFQTLTAVRPYGSDSLLVWDFALRRFTVLSRDGAVGRMVTFATMPGFLFQFDVLADGSPGGLFSGGVEPRGMSAGVHQIPGAYVRFDLQALRADTVTDVPGGSVFIDDRGTLISLPFGPETVAAAAGNLVYVGSGGRFEIRQYTESGRLSRVLRLERPNPPLPAERVDAYVENAVSHTRDPGERPAVESRYRSVPYPTTLPAYSQFVVDADTNLWVAAYQPDGDAPTRWTVFDPAGRLLGDVTIPPRFTVSEIGSDYLLGVSADSLGVERVQLLALDKPHPPAGPN